jgi:hypothetical protein
MRVERNEYADFFPLYKHSLSHVQVSEGALHSSEIRVKLLCSNWKMACLCCSWMILHHVTHKCQSVIEIYEEDTLCIATDCRHLMAYVGFTDTMLESANMNLSYKSMHNIHFNIVACRPTAK